MNGASTRENLTTIQLLSDRLGGILEEIREAPALQPLSPGARDALDQCIDINRTISEEAHYATSKIATVIPRKV